MVVMTRWAVVGARSSQASRMSARRTAVSKCGIIGTCKRYRPCL